jgi:metal-responsive CopG/Arc/MetJ family transcriptional regulator
MIAERRRNVAKTEQIHLRINNTLLAEIDKLAKTTSRTRSGWIRYVLEQRVGQEGLREEINGKKGGE